MRATLQKGTNQDNYPSAGGPDLDAETVPLVDEAFVVKASFGEPPQFFNLTLDTANYYTTLFSAENSFRVGSQWAADNDQVCYGTAEAPINATRNWFRQTESRTMRRSYFKRLGDTFQPFDLLGHPYTISNLALAETPVSVVDNVHFWLNPDWPSDGILGINRHFSSHLTDRTNASNSALERFLTAFDGRNTTATIVLESGPIGGPAEFGGWITFGGKDEESCSREWLYPESLPSWNLNVTSWVMLVEKPLPIFLRFSLGNVAYNSPMLGRIDSMSTFIRLPQPFVDNVIADLGALYDFESDAYYVDCADVTKLPDLGFRIGKGNLVGRRLEMVYTVPASDYARQVYSGLPNRCYLMMTSQAMFGHAETSDWLSLGATFMRSHCIMLDYSNGKVAVAEKKAKEEVPQ
ncbi:aspartic protease [Aphelenchoides avenae]|nr:aspartic protease [Aphelenchus avenae]